MAGGGFQSHAIPVYDVPGDTNAAHDDSHHERADRKEPVVHKRSIIEIELPVCTLLELCVFLKHMGLPGRIGEVEPLRTELHGVTRSGDLLVGQSQTNVLSGIIDIRCAYQPFKVDAGDPDAEEEHRVAQHHHDDADAGRKPPDLGRP